MNTTIAVTIVIPNWNGQSLLEKHLPQVLATVEEAEVIVVDDASTDKSIMFLTNEYPTIRVIEKNKHEGYASTVNVGVRQSRGNIVVLLNSDVEPEKGFLSLLLSHFSDPNVFAVGCMDKSIENGKTILRGRGVARWENGFYVHERGEVDKTDTAWVSGGSGAFRKSIWEKFGGMDELFNPFYWEDIDISYRAKKVGYHIVFEPKSIVTHYHEKGKIQNAYSSTQIKQIAYRNQFIFIWKHVHGVQLVLHCFWAPIRLFQALLGGDFSMISGYIRALIFLPKIFQYRIQSTPLFS